MSFLSGVVRRVRRGDAADAAPARAARRSPPARAYGANWVPRDETEAMDQILNNTDVQAFEAAGRSDADTLAPLIQPSDAVLDLGCGIGRVVRYVAPLCREIWAVDASERMLELARARLAELDNVRFSQSSGTELPELRDSSIDFAYSLLTLQHLEREDAFLLLREVRRVLRSGSRAYFTFPNLLSDTYLEHFVHYADAGETGNPARARFYTPQEVQRILPAAGFEVEQLEPRTEILVTCRAA